MYQLVGFKNPSGIALLSLLVVAFVVLVALEHMGMSGATTYIR